MSHPILKTTLLLGVAFVALPVSTPLAATSSSPLLTCLRDPNGNFVNEKGNLLNKEEAAGCLNKLAPAAGDDEAAEEPADQDETTNEQNGDYDAPDAPPETPVETPTTEPETPVTETPPEEPVDETPVESPENPQVDEPTDTTPVESPENPPVEEQQTEPNA